MSSKRTRGVYFTTLSHLGNPFLLDPFQDWVRSVDLSNQIILEPFAGANHLIENLRDLGLCRQYVSYDLNPVSCEVKKRNTIKNFPTGFRVAITNPPWLARNSATRRGLSYPKTPYRDLYLYCLELCLKHCEFSAVLLPASFLRSGLFRERLSSFVFLNSNLFLDTENPVALALFVPSPTEKTQVYSMNEWIGYLENLEAYLPTPSYRLPIRFNDPKGELGLIAYDSTQSASIRFVLGEELSRYSIVSTSRSITRIRIGNTSFSSLRFLINRLNYSLEEFRSKTQDIFLTPFKGLRKDGKYRRRLHYRLARSFIERELESRDYVDLFLPVQKREYFYGSGS